MKRALVLLGATLASSVAAGLAGALALMLALQPPEVSAGGWVSWIVLLGGIIAAYAGVAILTLGLAAHALLSRLGWLGWASYVAAGIVAGGVVSILFGATQSTAVLVTGLTAGVVGATTFWIVARPDLRVGAGPVAG